jgi:hypothetical protein
MKSAGEIIFSVILGHEGSYDRHGIVRNTSPGFVTEHILEELAAHGYEIVKRGDATLPASEPEAEDLCLAHALGSPGSASRLPRRSCRGRWS